ncbi:MAG: cytochrome c [Deltaproteobacteria bacterium]|nr:cytochrome c [Deltaproteobacteria bacterium]
MKMGKFLRQLVPVAFLCFLCLFLSIQYASKAFAGWSGAGAPQGVDAGAPSIYLQWCSQCHGLSGRGDGINSTPDMAINPRDHTDASYMSTRSDEQLKEIIQGGGTRLAKSPLMPPWGATLTEGEIDALVVYLRELCKCGYEGIMTHEKLRRVDPSFR